MSSVMKSVIDVKKNIRAKHGAVIVYSPNMNIVSPLDLTVEPVLDT